MVLHARLAEPLHSEALRLEMVRLRHTQQQGNRLLAALTGVLAASVAVALWALSR
ncbi:Uncharacterised protein [Mycobacteroides abscessus subsp. abscessus]|nr:Uncharacterised protein [Mycobacteroides abscessus subsp. abscessus]